MLLGLNDEIKTLSDVDIRQRAPRRATCCRPRLMNGEFRCNARLPARESGGNIALWRRWLKWNVPSKNCRRGKYRVAAFRRAAPARGTSAVAEPRIFSDEQLRAWMDGDEAAMRVPIRRVNLFLDASAVLTACGHPAGASRAVLRSPPATAGN